MAEPLKNQFGPDVPAQIARMVEAVFPSFQSEAFLLDALDGYEELELTPRAWQIARALRRHLPDDYPEAIRILLASLGPRLKSAELVDMTPFIYLPHVFFVAEYGLDHFDASMAAQYELTQRFTAEFSIRAFLERYPEQTLDRLRQWARDPSVHVRRLVSEGTRPRLPWAPHLRRFQQDPRPVLELLELLKDDPELYVRRSVANNLNDIGKDHPDVLIETCRRWAIDATPERWWLIRHGLRSALKRGDPAALALLGFGQDSQVDVGGLQVEPSPVRIGQSATIAFVVRNHDETRQSLLIDLRVHFVKANGGNSPKVFKLKSVELAPGEQLALRKRVSFKQHTTRTHYPGTHSVDALVNGMTYSLGSFEVEPEQ